MAIILSIMACSQSHQKDRTRLVTSATTTLYNDDVEGRVLMKQFFFVRNQDTSYLNIDVIFDSIGINTISLSQNSVYHAYKYNIIEDIYLEPKPSDDQKNRFFLTYYEIKSLITKSFPELERIGFSDQITLCFHLSSLADMSATIYKRYEEKDSASIDTEMLKLIILKSDWIRFINELFSQHDMVVSKVELGELGCVGDDFYTCSVFQQVEPSDLSDQLIEAIVYVSLHRMSNTRYDND